jgi:hypothetical protein
VTEDEIYAFVRDSIGSVWALELLLLLRRADDRIWSSAELVRELRSSDTAVTDCLTKLVDLGIVSGTEDGFRYQPSSGKVAHSVDELQKLYAAKPISVMKAMGSTNFEILRIFFYQNLIIGVIGTTLGLLLGLAVCKGLRVYSFPLDTKEYYVSHLPVSVQPLYVLGPGVIAIGICMVATLAPSLYAATIVPAEGFREQ